MQDAGRDARITIGPWRHTDRGVVREGLVEALALFRAALHGDRSGLRDKRVRLYVQQAEQWREFEQWPPEGARTVRWHLHPENGLDGPPAATPGPTALRYDRSQASREGKEG